MGVKYYKEHLRETIKNWEDAFGYIRECAKDGDLDVLQLAVRDVWEFAAHHQRESDAKVAELDSVLDWVGGSTGNAKGTARRVASAIRANPLFGSERNQT